jgi:hypothetical protein
VLAYACQPPLCPRLSNTKNCCIWQDAYGISLQRGTVNLFLHGLYSGFVPASMLAVPLRLNPNPSRFFLPMYVDPKQNRFPNQRNDEGRANETLFRQPAPYLASPGLGAHPSTRVPSIATKRGNEHQVPSHKMLFSATP